MENKKDPTQDEEVASPKEKFEITKDSVRHLRNNDIPYKVVREYLNPGKNEFMEIIEITWPVQAEERERVKTVLDRLAQAHREAA